MIGVVDALRDLSGQPHAVTIGNFDGVHRGHRYLIQKLCDDARSRGIRSLVMTFEPHPTSVLRPDVKLERLTTPAAKLALLESSGVDAVAVVEFTREVAALTPDEFLSIVLESAKPQSVVIGEGFRFGSRRSGTTDGIEQFGQAHGFDTTVISRLTDDDAMISSTNIRAALHAGDIAKANEMLGRRYRLLGKVEHGQARGRELGFPTANMVMPSDVCIPGDGIYAAYAHLPAGGGGPFQAMVYIGSRPTFDNGDRIVEANILDFSGDIYTQDLETEFVAFVRGDAAFDSPEALMQQMARDEEVTRATLERERPDSTR
jgi:riboflavin kinase/FMN adenylyltransferase